MIPIQGYYKIAVKMYQVPIRVLDVVYSNVNGIDTRTLNARRTIQAAINPAKASDIVREFGSPSSQGFVRVWTEETLYSDEESDPGDTRRQSFFQYEGDIFRVSSTPTWNPQTSINIYVGKKHFAQDSYVASGLTIQQYFLGDDWEQA
jgi:hypothetical protein